MVAQWESTPVTGEGPGFESPSWHMADLDSELLKAFKGAMHNTAEGGWKGTFQPTGIIPVDHSIGGVCGRGGFGETRTHEVYGNWSTGKTLILYEWLIHVQMVLGGKSILFEGEGGFAPKWYQNMGGILDKGDPRSLLYYPDLRTVEDFFDGVMTIIQTVKKLKYDKPVAIGLDSIAAIGTKHLQKEGTTGSRDMTKAYQISQGLKMITPHLQGTKIAIVGTNHITKVVGAKDWEEANTPGGRAWPYYSSARIELKYDGGPRGSLIMSKEDKDAGIKPAKIGRYVRGEVVKNKLAAPWNKFKLPLYVKEGYPHPVFDDTLTRLGVDKAEATLNWYLSEDAVFGPDKEWVLKMGGGGRITLNSKISKTSAAESGTFYKKQWLKIIEVYPQLMTLNPFQDAAA